MVEEFKYLRDDEVEVMMRAPIYVALLIAGADGKIDNNERKEAINIAREKQSRARDQLVNYYTEVGNNFEQKFEQLLKELPSDTAARNDAIAMELRKLNYIFKKIDKNFSIKLYGSLKDLAKKIAEASGGVLGYLSVSYEESKLMDLRMINDPSKG